MTNRNGRFGQPSRQQPWYNPPAVERGSRQLLGGNPANEIRLSGPTTHPDYENWNLELARVRRDQSTFSVGIHLDPATNTFSIPDGFQLTVEPGDTLRMTDGALDGNFTVTPTIDGNRVTVTRQMTRRDAIEMGAETLRDWVDTQVVQNARNGFNIGGFTVREQEMRQEGRSPFPPLNLMDPVIETTEFVRQNPLYRRASLSILDGVTRRLAVLAPHRPRLNPPRNTNISANLANYTKGVTASKALKQLAEKYKAIMIDETTYAGKTFSYRFNKEVGKGYWYLTNYDQIILVRTDLSNKKIDKLMLPKPSDFPAETDFSKVLNLTRYLWRAIGFSAVRYKDKTKVLYNRNLKNVDGSRNLQASSVSSIQLLAENQLSSIIMSPGDYIGFENEEGVRYDVLPEPRLYEFQKELDFTKPIDYGKFFATTPGRTFNIYDRFFSGTNPLSTGSAGTSTITFHSPSYADTFATTISYF